MIAFETNVHIFGIPKTRKAQIGAWLAIVCGDRRSCFDEAGERGEDLADLTTMFEPVVITFSVAVVTHHIGERRTRYSRAGRFCRPRERSRWELIPCHPRAVQRPRTRPDCRGAGTNAIACNWLLPRGFCSMFSEFRKREKAMTRNFDSDHRK